MNPRSVAAGHGLAIRPLAVSGNTPDSRWCAGYGVGFRLSDVPAQLPVAAPGLRPLNFPVPASRGLCGIWAGRWWTRPAREKREWRNWGEMARHSVPGGGRIYYTKLHVKHEKSGGFLRLEIHDPLADGGHLDGLACRAHGINFGAFRPFNPNFFAVDSQ